MEIHDNEKRFSPHRDLANDFLDEMSHSRSEEEEEEMPPLAPFSPSDCSDDNNNDNNSNNGSAANNDYDSGSVVSSRGNDETFDTLDDFGEDTLHCLMDSDLRLGTVPPLSSLRSSHHDEEFDDDECEEELQLERGDKDDRDDDFENAQPDALNDIIEEDDNTASESLLRGPLMAARSFASMNVGNSNMNIVAANHSIIAAGATTPSTAREQFLSCRKEKMTIDSSLGQMEMKQPLNSYEKKPQNHTTPSTARSTFLSAKNETAAALYSSTPSNLVISTNKPPLSAKSVDSSDRQRAAVSAAAAAIIAGNTAPTPSTTRQQFLTSPQDSLSTIGSSSADDRAVHTTRVIQGEGITPSRVREGFVSPGIPRDSHGIADHSMDNSMFTFDNADLENSIHDAERIAATPSTLSVHPTGENRNRGEGRNNRATPQSVLSNHTAKSSVGRLIALGEEQMKQQQQSAAAAVVPKVDSTKRSFLKKGTRKEPSSIHTLKQPPNTTNTVNKSAAGTTTTTETASQRKTRLARLEKMQQDLVADYEKREKRKEEAKRERRRLRMIEVGGQDTARVGAKAASKVGSVESRLEESTKKALQSVITPGQQGRARSTGRGKYDENPTPSAAGAKSAVKTRHASVERPQRSVAKKEGVTVLSPTADMAVKQAKRNVRGQTPSKVRAAQTPTAQPECVDHPEKLTGDEDVQNFSEDEADVQSNGDDGSYSDEEVAVELKPKPNKSKQVKMTTAARRPRSVSRPKTTQLKSTTNSLSPKRNNSKAAAASNEKAFEDWKTKESEEWALIKNMRRRQEAALREAEGERERAKAWAAAERESTKKWVEEQRAIIQKDRHKASNAALLAAKKAEKNKANAPDEDDAMNAELEELRAQITKLRIEAYEAKKLKEQLRKQERTIAALKNGQVGTPKAAVERRALEDCTASKTNKASGAAAKPKTPQNRSVIQEYPTQQDQRKPLGIIVDTGNDDYVSDEEDTDVWLERNLNELNVVNPKPDQKSKEAPAANPTASHHGPGNRKPYNAADYGAPANMSSSTATQNHYVGTASPAFSNLNGAPSGTPKSSQFFTYQNGTQKEVLSDGTTTVYFTNGDRKRTYANEKKGIVVYYYAATQVTHQDGKQTYHFPNKQIEDHHVDGTKEISYPDGTKRVIYTDGITDTTFPDGVRVVDYPDGRQQVHQIC